VVDEFAVGVVDKEAAVLASVTAASPVYDDVHEAAKTMIAAVTMSEHRNPTIDLATSILHLAPKVKPSRTYRHICAPSKPHMLPVMRYLRSSGRDSF
jgi:hypothetical protein